MYLFSTYRSIYLFGHLVYPINPPNMQGLLRPAYLVDLLDKLSYHVDKDDGNR